MEMLYDNTYIYIYLHILFGGFNPVEKYSSNGIISPSKGTNKEIETTT